MEATSLETAILDQQIRHINFFNGRLLSGEDLTAERDATHAHATRLGQAIGTGIASGLEVTKITGSSTGAQVQVKAGLAVNPCGQVLRLACDQVVSLLRPTTTVAGDECVFSDCEPYAGTSIATDGFYLLAIAPASKKDGLAVVNGLGNLPAPCNSGYLVEGIQFRLLAVTPSPAPEIKYARNATAYQFFGRPGTTPLNFANDGLVSAAPRVYGGDTPGLVTGLTRQDVPLALIRWDAQGITFVDLWSVRRPITCPPATQPWAYFTGARRWHEAIAMFQQFQDQLRDIPRVNSSWAAVKATDQFQWLPPAGILPIGSVNFVPQTFFEKIPLRTVPTEAARLRFLVFESFTLEPFSLSAPPDSIDIYTFRDAPEIALFMRGQPEPSSAGATTSTPPTAMNEPTATSAKIIIGVTMPGTRKRWPPIEVTVASGGKRYRVNEYEMTELDRFFGRNWPFQDSRGEWRIFATENIPAEAHYDIVTKAAGYRIDKQSKRPALNAVEIVVVRLARTQANPSDSLTKSGKDEMKVNGAGIRKVIAIKWPRPPEEVEKLKDPGVVDPIPDELEQQLDDSYQEWLREDPALPITTSKRRIIYDGNYLPENISSEPSAYVQSEGGYSIPLVMVPANLALPFATPVSDGDVREAKSASVEARLVKAGIGDLDVAAHAWTELITDALGIGEDAAKSLVREFKGAAAKIRADRTYYPGMDEKTARQLKDKGLDDAKIANASFSELKDAVGSEEYAERLSSYARSIVPAESWSLENSKIGLTNDQVTALKKNDVETLGQLAGRAKTPDLLKALGTTESEFDSLKGKAGAAVASGAIALSAEPPLSKILRADTTSIRKLAKAGIESTTSLANTPGDKIALVLGVSQKDAADLVKTATTEVLVARAGVTADQAKDLVVASTAPNLNTVLDKALESGTLSGDALHSVRALRIMRVGTFR